jgi:hypothetical protein
MSALFLTLMVMAANPDPRVRPVPADPYQMPIMSSHAQCITEKQGTLPSDPNARGKAIDTAIAVCRATMDAALDRGEMSPRNRPLTRHQRRSTAVALDRTEEQVRASMMNLEALAARYAGLARPGVELSDRPTEGMAPGVVVLDPIAPYWSLYSRCVIAHMRAGGPISPDGHDRIVRRALDRCRDDRESLMARSDAALAAAPDYRDPARRRDAIRAAFDGFDAMMLDFPALRASGRLPGQRASTKDDNAEN